jgi:Predicted Zn-dependent peptidases
MNKIPLTKLDLTIYREVLDNGLTIYVLPKNNVSNIYATLTTKYGSNVNEFKIPGESKFIKVNDGIAHFLEHKLFETEEGGDPFTFFSNNGADANASTTLDKTSYLFTGPDKFKENLNYLLDYVQSPYFTDENVEKEKGIIEEEILMYKDNPYSCLYDQSLFNSFVVEPIRYSVLGTKTSISTITKEMLYTCYNTFYNPSNLVLVVSGNVDEDYVFNIVKDNQDGKEFRKTEKIETKEYKEPDYVLKKEVKIKQNVTIPKIALNYKFNISKLNKYQLPVIRSLIYQFFNIKLGFTSKFNEDIKREKLCNDHVDISVVNTKTHMLVTIFADTNKPKELIEKIKEVLNDKEIDEMELERKKKVLKSSYIYSGDNIFRLGNKIINNIVSYDIILDDCSFIDGLKIESLNDIINSIDFSNICEVIIDSK